MPIKVEETDFPEVIIIRGNRFYDERGFFTEAYKESEYQELGIPRFIQDNMSESSRGVIRGLHWQESPFGQGKLVNCMNGSILDVAVDIRKNSKTYGKHVTVELNGRDQASLWIPEGFAHGFQALEDQTRVYYKVTNYWNSKSERSINPLDKDLGIQWLNIPATISQKDKESLGFSIL